MNEMKSVAFVVLLWFGVGFSNADLKEVLNDPRYLRPYMNNDIKEVFESINDIKSNWVIIETFCKNNKLYPEYGLVVLYRCNNIDCISFLKKTKFNMDGQQWGYFLENAITSRNVDTLLTNYITSRLLIESEWAVKSCFASYLSENGTKTNVNKIEPLLNSETDKNVRISIIQALIRYKNVQNDSLVKNIFLQFKEPELINIVMQTSLLEYNRFDFIETINKLNKKIQSKNAAFSEHVNETLAIMKEIVPILEKKKAENAPIGLPLDWPGDGK